MTVAHDTEGNLSKSPVQTLKVLVADDDPPTRILLRTAIAQWQYEVMVAKDGEEAWEILQQSDAPRLLVLDWLMPKIDGITLCERIKKSLKHYTYIILLTHQTGTENVIKGLEAGADEFLSKPFNMAELRSRLSVGARIVMYDHTLTKQNNLLKIYYEKIAELEQLTLKMLSVINDKKSSKNDIYMEKIKELDSDLKKMTSLFASMKEDKKS